VTVEAAIGVALVTGFFTLCAAFGGSLITAALALFATVLNQRHQTAEGRFADKRRVRDAKPDRIRPPLRQLLQAAWTINQVMIDQNMLRGEQTEEERDAEILEQWRSAMSAANEALLDLTMEQDTDQLKSSFRDLCDSFRRYQQQRNLAKEKDAEWPSELWDEVDVKVSNFESLVREAATEAEQPL
jgi:hypothetical protein